jgi:hypothetical protein
MQDVMRTETDNSEDPKLFLPYSELSLSYQVNRHEVLTAPNRR